MANKKINPFEYDYIITKMTEFFKNKGLIKTFVQNELSILAACEDPTTIAEFMYSGQKFPLIQTGQMHLEQIILHYGKKIAGVFIESTSYRQEQNIVVGRHETIFPLIEFEIHGDVDELENFQRQLLEHLGFGHRDSFPSGDYLDICKKYGTDELTHEHEMMLYKDYGAVYFIKNFSEKTAPFWNMTRNKNGTAKKIDVILCGQECFGSAERAVDPIEMNRLFHSINDGAYANTLYEKFGKDRVEAELTEFLNNDFFVRSGCGIGYTRLLRALKIMNLLPSQD